jgi:hypothetical protein
MTIHQRDIPQRAANTQDRQPASRLQEGRPYPLGATWDGKTVNMWVNGERDNSYQSTAVPLKRSFPEVIELGCDSAGSRSISTAS